ncbi:MAG: hypothetical protein A2498_04405 [Lentisphaerae bacterium RIFOXYC12_FULL_60_16]|nr:MAG: hypothetical protein A2498_04405 [Lentisphaerae bacterium RIFOXYC12_FULL_60_16]OGV83825.1 MAG: hypothetical protein A2340_05430 [Lentisphaerae bacterium RIFOXYB12_FULL_60_10]
MDLQVFVDLCIKGGIFMVPLALVGLAAIVLTIERFIFLHQNRVDWDHLHFELRSAIKDRDLERAVVLAARTKGMVGRVLAEGLVKIQEGHTDIVAATEKIIHSEMRGMEKSRGWLLTLAQVAPLIGILGTVYGLVVSFMAIEQSASTDPRILAGGIYQALITTVAGLVIAIPIILVQEHVRRETNRILHYLDLFLMEIRDGLENRAFQAREVGRG